MAENLLEINNLTVTYGQFKIITEVSFKVKPGEIVCIAGESGCGKSTLIKAVLGLKQLGAQVQEGNIILDGRDITRLGVEERRQILGTQIGYVPQNTRGSFNNIRSYEIQYKETMNCHGLPFVKADAVDVFKRLNFPDAEDILSYQPWEMSGGMNQRMAIGLAVLQKPKLMLADEATSVLDVTSQKEVIEELGIKVLPFMITVNGESFRETFDKSNKEFYELMAATDEIPKHAQINPNTFEEAYKELYDQGYTDVISVSINSNGSGTYNNSIIGKNDFYEKNPEAREKMRIFNLDSKCYTIFYGYPIMESVKKIRKGADADEIIAYLEDWFNVCGIYAVPYNLKYARKSGRISAAAAFAGELLGLKPIILFADGGTETVEKIRGEKNIVPKLVDCVERNMTPQTPYIIIHGRDNTLAKEVEKEMIKRTGRKAEMFSDIGAAVASNIGPDIVAVLVRRKNK